MSDSRPRVAVIGGGVFGCKVALALDQSGWAVTLLERRPTLSSGATRNNTGRLHLGYHYPRDPGTARQCKLGFQRFVNEFPECVCGEFPNAYFIASSGSLTSPDEYLEFCRGAGLSFQTIDLDEHPEIRGCALGILADECIYDSGILAELLTSRIANSRIRLICGADVTGLERRGTAYRITSRGGAFSESFDAVVACCYDENNRLTQKLGKPVTEYQFEYTIIPIVELDIARQALTVMDGPFVSLLPYGKSEQFLLYHVQHTVVATEVGPTRDPGWSHPAKSPAAKLDLHAFFERMRDAATEYIPSLARAKLVGVFQGPRVVLASHDQDDARPSIVTEVDDGFVSVFSGKVDHSAWVTDEVLSKLTRRFGAQLPQARVWAEG